MRWTAPAACRNLAAAKKASWMNRDRFLALIENENLRRVPVGQPGDGERHRAAMVRGEPSRGQLRNDDAKLRKSRVEETTKTRLRSGNDGA